MIIALAICALLIIFGVYRRQITKQLKSILSQLSDDAEITNVVGTGNSSVTAGFTQVATNIAAIKAELDNYSSTINGINDAVIKTDEKGIVLHVNQSCMRLFQCEKNVLVGQNYQFAYQAIKVEEEQLAFSDILSKISSNTNTQTFYSSIFHVQVKEKTIAVEQQITAIFDDEDFVGTVIVLRDVTQAEKLRKRLRFQANHDNVTKLFNRYKFEQRLVDAWHETQEKGLTHALLQLDMDRFKLVNDNAGHAAGDQLLRDIGQVLKATVRQSDICARIGGDEFAVLLYNISQDTVLRIMSQLNQAIKSLNFNYSGQTFEVGASIGATLITKDSPPIVEVKRQADTACFIAKNKGINCHQLFSDKDQISSSLQQEPRWAARIHQALEQDEFALFYQPIRETTNPTSVNKQHIEILLRLKSEDSLLSPGVFLPAVERFRLSDKVDAWVISKAFSWLESQPHLWESQVVAINLSGDSVINANFIDSVLACHQQYSFPAHAICFEITETAAIANMNQAAQMIDKLRAVGFTIALDDFGKGFSTFSYLKNLPAQFIKIDGSYVEDILNNNCDLSIVKAITAMAKTMNMKTIAEFVQCDEAVLLLKSLGVDYVQGFGIGKPAPLNEYTTQQPIEKTNTPINLQQTIH